MNVEKAAPEPPNRTVAAAEPLEELTDPREQPLPAPSAGAAGCVERSPINKHHLPSRRRQRQPHEVTMAEEADAPDFVVTRQLDQR